MKRKNIKFARMLRKKQTDAEKEMWHHLRGKRFEGLKFRRQHTIGNYIVDFVCLEKKLIVELDGGQHVEQKERDNERDNWLIMEGYRVLRFWDNDVLAGTKSVLENIYNVIFSSI